MYLCGFSKALTQRESCYSCQYATASRVGDITLGDFWGLGKNKPFEHDTKNGVSVVLVNTEKGKQYIGELDKLFLEERSVDEAVDGNAHLKKPVLPHKNREKFISSYKKKSFKSSARESLSKELFISRAYSVLASVKPLRKALGKLVRIVKK